MPTDRRTIQIRAEAAARIAAAGVRLNLPDAAVVELIAPHADALGPADAARLPATSRGRKGQGRRPKTRTQPKE